MEPPTEGSSLGTPFQGSIVDLQGAFVDFRRGSKPGPGWGLYRLIGATQTSFFFCASSMVGPWCIVRFKVFLRGFLMG